MGNQALEAALASTSSHIEHLRSLPNAVGDLTVVRVRPPVAPRQLDVERSAIAVERLPRCRLEHKFRKADKAPARPRIFTGTLMVIMPVCHSATPTSVRNDRIIARCPGR